MLTRDHIASSGTDQIHFFGGGIDHVDDHWENLDFSVIRRFSHGHHGRAGGGNDVFNFRYLDRVFDTVVGRLEDYDHSRDEIRVEGLLLDFDRLPDNIKVVDYNGAHNDIGSEPQQWLMISTSTGGRIFYALEGALLHKSHKGFIS